MRIISSVQSINGGMMFQTECDCGAFMLVAREAKSVECLACKRASPMATLHDAWTKAKLSSVTTST